MIFEDNLFEGFNLVNFFGAAVSMLILGALAVGLVWMFLVLMSGFLAPGLLIPKLWELWKGKPNRRRLVSK